MKPILIIMALMLIPTSSAWADSCDNTLFKNSQGIQTATAKKKIYFQNDKGALEKSHILKGDKVVIISQVSGKACAFFLTPKTDIWGWVELKDLGPLRKLPTKLADWKGTFQDGLGSVIKLTPQMNGRVKAYGMAVWGDIKSSSAHDGEIDDEGEIKDGVVDIGSPEANGIDCTVELRLLSRNVLLAQKKDRSTEASSCWGFNVSFNGFYYLKVKK